MSRKSDRKKSSKKQKYVSSEEETEEESEEESEYSEEETENDELEYSRESASTTRQNQVMSSAMSGLSLAYAWATKNVFVIVITVIFIVIIWMYYKRKSVVKSQPVVEPLIKPSKSPVVKVPSQSKPVQETNSETVIEEVVEAVEVSKNEKVVEEQVQIATSNSIINHDDLVLTIDDEILNEYIEN